MATSINIKDYKGLSIEGDNFKFDPTLYGLPSRETGGQLQKINNSPFQQQVLEQPQFMFADGGLLQGNYGQGLPELGFGSWLGDNAGKILKTAGGIVSVIPGVGQIAGPILIGAGAATDSIVGGVRNKRADQQLATDAQLAIDEQTTADKQQQDLMNLTTRRSNLVDQTVNYGATFEDGGEIGQGLLGEQPQIVEYINGGKHDESATRGIPVDARGNPATTSRQSAVGLTEEGEVTWNSYVFSDKIKYNG